MLGNDADALDATQDALVAAIRAIGRFDGRSSFGTWLYRIATNTCLDEIRRRRRRPVTGIATDLAEVADDISFGAPGLFVVPTRGDQGWDHPRSGRSGRADTASGGAHDPADIVAARLDIDAALASLSVEFRTAVVLRDVCDLPYEEISEILGVPVGTVRSRIARARSALATTWHDSLGNDSSSPDVKTRDTARPPTEEERTQ